MQTSWESILLIVSAITETCVKKSLISTLITICSICSAFAIQKPHVAVFEFAPEGVSKQTALIVSRNLRSSLTEMQRMVVLERSQMDSVLKAQGQNLDDCTEEGCGIIMGRMLDAEMIVLGEVSRIGNGFVLSARLIDLETGRLVVAKDLLSESTSEDALINDAPQLAAILSSGYPLKALVVESGEDIMIDAGIGLVLEGQRFIVKRIGREIINPNTGESLGFDINDVGEVEVVRVLGESLSKCRKIKGDIQVNDVIEIALDAQDQSRVIARNEVTKQSTNEIFTPLPDMEFVLIPGGSFMMGSNDGDTDEKPIHKVTIDPFYMMTTEVTQKLWKEVMGNNPSFFKGDGLPVEQVTWNEVQEFIKKLNMRESGKEYRLPSEAEWEYACREGMSNYVNEMKRKELDLVGWFNDNSEGSTHAVKMKSKNGFGIYDMIGNVWEWCEDWYCDSYYRSTSDGNACNVGDGMYRALRGGSWSNGREFCRATDRIRNFPDYRRNNYGFRLVRSGND